MTADLVDRYSIPGTSAPKTAIDLAIRLPRQHPKSAAKTQESAGIFRTGWSATCERDECYRCNRTPSRCDSEFLDLRRRPLLPHSFVQRLHAWSIKADSGTVRQLIPTQTTFVRLQTKDASGAACHRLFSRLRGFQHPTHSATRPSKRRPRAIAMAPPQQLWEHQAAYRKGYASSLAAGNVL